MKPLQALLKKQKSFQLPQGSGCKSGSGPQRLACARHDQALDFEGRSFRFRQEEALPEAVLARWQRFEGTLGGLARHHAQGVEVPWQVRLCLCGRSMFLKRCVCMLAQLAGGQGAAAQAHPRFGMKHETCTCACLTGVLRRRFDWRPQCYTASAVTGLYGAYAF